MLMELDVVETQKHIELKKLLVQFPQNLKLERSFHL